MYLPAIALMMWPLRWHVTCMQVLLQRYEQVESETVRLRSLCSLHDQPGRESHLLTRCDLLSAPQICN